MNEAAGKTYDVIMVGAGPSALSAAVYTTREDLSTLLIEKGVVGGLAAITDKVDNYPGFVDGITGLELAQAFEGQAERFGSAFEYAEVKTIEKQDDLLVAKTDFGDFKAKTVLIATGSHYNQLGVPGEQELYGRGVHYCATCDGAFYKGKKIVVVGGGNSAAQEALFLTRFSDNIQVLVRGDKWKASDVLVKEIEENDKITTSFNTEAVEIKGDDKVSVIATKNNKTDGSGEIETDAIFIFIGLSPNTDFLKGTEVELDEFGFVKTDENLKTAMDGVFCSGDVRSGATMQIASAVGEGAKAALMIRKHLEGHA